MAPNLEILATFGKILTGWLYVAAIPLIIWIASLVTDKTRKPAFIGALVVGILLAGACLIVDFWKSFGEAFVEGVDNGRRPIWLSLTGLATLLFCTLAALKPKEAKSDRGSTKGSGVNGTGLSVISRNLTVRGWRICRGGME